ncbi:phosphoenolpyruvate--protein phosphotransferase [Alkalispirochaeta alkalica]|uniref:phosphoenolpyruvate--protein phosphotransferase n=1 Tax=Alkalispirochaeta alkalica TaxID=46356 RepID=UPI0003A746BE|nr:phosphoenolpyruvate--protein phosphotransferase [Alkalispirochaeta alkalica]
MTELNGIAASPGIAIGTVYLYRDDIPRIPRYRISQDQLEAERLRLDEAVARAGSDIEAIQSENGSDLEGDERTILDSHLLMLRDPSFLDSLKNRMEQELLNIEWILARTVKEMMNKLATAGDAYLRERTSDILDVAKRILNHLLDRSRPELADLDEEVVLVTHDLMPSDAVAMNKRMVQAIAMDAGGKTSHTAILARSFEIPAVLGLETISRTLSGGEKIIVDGNHGVVIIDPDAATLQRYARLQGEWQEHEVQLMRLNALPAETADGKLISLKGNIEVPEEVEGVGNHGADGIGLYRSEFLFLGTAQLPSEEQQYRAYYRVLEAMAGKPVTIRTLDVGGDKVSEQIRARDEKNPILGWRAIRVCLSEVEVFRTQLRALLRASVHGRLRIMFPMISGVMELTRAMEIFEEVRQELRDQGVPFDEEIPVGIMIEVPSAALTTDILAKKVDFFSIGTNDLIQYTVAVDRGNERVAYLYEPFHPGVLRLIKIVIDSAHAEGISVAMCGEMAGDPVASMVLLGLGLDEFSMSSAGIPEVKRIIRSVSMAEAEELAGNVMEMRSSAEIDREVRTYMQERFSLF